MDIVVCIKQVPDTSEVSIDPETNTLVREGVPSIINPFDVLLNTAGISGELLPQCYGDGIL